MKKIFIFLTAIVFLAGCTSTPKRSNIPTPVASIQTVSEGEYILTNLFPEANLTLGFDEEGRIFGFSGINRYFGKADINNGTIVVEPLATTKMAGPQAKMIIEDQYLTILKSAKTIEIKNDSLILTNERGETLIFNKK